VGSHPSTLIRSSPDGTIPSLSQPPHALITHYDRYNLTHEAKYRYVDLTTCRDGAADRREEYQNKEKSTVLLESRDESDDECEYGNESLASVLSAMMAYLEHLDERHRQMQIGDVAQHQTCGE